MATLAAILDLLAINRGEEAESPRVRVQNGEPFVVGAFPNEDIFFFAKRIDNTRVLRKADPVAGRVCWRMIGGSLAGAIALVALMLPVLYGKFAGYKIESLRKEREQLRYEQTMLDLREARFLNPENLERMAIQRNFIEGGAKTIVYLESKTGVREARSAAPSTEQAR